MPSIQTPLSLLEILQNANLGGRETSPPFIEVKMARRFSLAPGARVCLYNLGLSIPAFLG